MRLRPSGAAGLLVSSLGAFQRYQEQEAWTWEHQALVRARVLAGCRRVQASFEAVRAEVLARPRDLDALRTEVSEMRAKMRDNLGTRATAAGTASNAFEATAAFDLKHDAGGIVDIEFMVQYAVLAWSGEHPALLEFTDNIRILEGLERAGLIASEDVPSPAGGLQGLSRSRTPPGTTEGGRGRERRALPDGAARSDQDLARAAARLIHSGT